jgi:hypothetical protein
MRKPISGYHSETIKVHGYYFEVVAYLWTQVAMVYPPPGAVVHSGMKPFYRLPLSQWPRVIAILNYYAQRRPNG